MDINGRLDALGWEGDRADFDDLLVEVLHAYCPDWTDEQLLCRPTMALEYVSIVRRRCHMPAMPEELICRALVNIRRRSEQRSGADG